MRNKWVGRKVKILVGERQHDVGVVCRTSKNNLHIKFPDNSYAWHSLSELHVRM